MSTDMLTEAPTTALLTRKEIMGRLRAGCIDAAQERGFTKTATNTLYNLCTRVETNWYRYPDKTLVEVALLAIQALERTRMTCKSFARIALLDVIKDMLNDEDREFVMRTCVVFEGTQMPLGELSSCQRYVLRHYAMAWATTVGGEDMHDIESRVTWTIELGLATLAAEEWHRPVKLESRMGAAEVFRAYANTGKNPLIFAL